MKSRLGANRAASSCWAEQLRGFNGTNGTDQDHSREPDFPSLIVAYSECVAEWRRQRARCSQQRKKCWRSESNTPDYTLIIKDCARFKTADAIAAKTADTHRCALFKWNRCYKLHKLVQEMPSNLFFFKFKVNSTCLFTISVNSEF